MATSLSVLNLRVRDGGQGALQLLSFAQKKSLRYIILHKVCRDFFVGAAYVNITNVNNHVDG